YRQRRVDGRVEIDRAVTYPHSDHVVRVLALLLQELAGGFLLHGLPELARGAPRVLSHASRGRELREVVDPEGLLDLGDLPHDLLETVFSEELLLFRLELLAEVLELPWAHEAAERGEEHGVF